MKKTGFLLIVLILISCTTIKPVKERACFEFKIPPGMYDNKSDAGKYRYDNFIIENEKNFEQSSIMIAIRHVDVDKNRDLKAFVDSDQYWLTSQVPITFDRPWIPSGFENKKINYISYQFYYKQQGQLIYQRSVYIKCNDTVYIISMSSKDKKNLTDQKNDFFWENINTNQN